MSDWDGFFAHTAERYGAIDLRDGSRFGIDPQALRRRARAEGWAVPFPGRPIRLHPASAPTYERRVSAGLLALGDRALASRRTAAFLQGLIDRPPPKVSLVVPYDRRAPKLGSGFEVWRSRTLLERDASAPCGLASTALDRTVCDLAAVSSPSAMRSYLIDGRQRRLFDLDEIMRRQALMAGTTGLPLLRALCYQLDATRCDSVLAWRARGLLTEAGMRPDRSEHPVQAPNGVTVHLDVPFVRYRVAVEAEGLGAHAERWQLERDIRRRNTLRLIPWRIVWVTWQQLDEDPDSFIDQVRSELEHRGWPGDRRS
ncbi:MAG: hypothetical protein KY437_02970 [Actinobacteria bacterium]|nr:hypothetical protein [Actinomycetota bacterium]